MLWCTKIDKYQVYPPSLGDIRDSKGHLKDLDDVDLAFAAGLGQIFLCAFCSQEEGAGYPPNLCDSFLPNIL